jgi:excisionase family DNA binding protein
MGESERWLSVEEIGAHLGVSKETIYRWLEKKKIPAHRVGRLWKFKTHEVDQWVMNGRATSRSVARGKGLYGEVN